MWRSIQVECWRANEQSAYEWTSLLVCALARPVCLSPESFLSCICVFELYGLLFQRLLLSLFLRFFFFNHVWLNERRMALTYTQVVVRLSVTTVFSNVFYCLVHSCQNTYTQRLLLLCRLIEAPAACSQAYQLAYTRCVCSFLFTYLLVSLSHSSFQLKKLHLSLTMCIWVL